MIRSVLLLMVYLSFCVLGTTAPFIISLGYVWVDTVRPQEGTYFILNQFPVAFVMGVLAIGTYVALDRRSPPKLCFAWMVPMLLALYCIPTTAMGVAGVRPWDEG